MLVTHSLGMCSSQLGCNTKEVYLDHHITFAALERVCFLRKTLCKQALTEIYLI